MNAEMQDGAAKQSRQGYFSISGILVLAVVLLLVNAVSRSLLGRFYVDLTDENLYSLSDGSKSILNAVEDPITLKFYFSRTEGSKYPAVNVYGNRIGDLLRQYERAARGKIRVEINDPRPDSEEEDWAQKYGLSPIPTRSDERLFLGLAGVNGAGDEQVIPLFNLNRQESLEYDITKLIYSLVNTKKPTIGVLSPLDISGAAAPGQPPRGPHGGGGEPWFFYSQLAQSADVKAVKADTAQIDAGVDVLLVVHPKNLSDATLYAIDQFVMRGGKLVVLQDPFCQSDEPDSANAMAAMSADRGSDLNRLLQSWGVELVKDKVIGDIDLATRVNAGPGGAPKAFVLWLSVGRENINQEDLTTSSLDGVVLPWAGSLEIKPVEGVSVQPLMTTSKNAKLFGRHEFQFLGSDVDQLLRNYTPGGRELALAVRVSGHLKTNFPGGKPAASASESSSAGASEHLAQSKEVANVVVIADVDFISDAYSIQSQNLFGTPLVAFLNDNQSLFSNIVENLSGNNDLISIRSRGAFSRPFTRVQAIESEAQMRWQAEEAALQAKLNAANQRLSQYQNQGKEEGGKQVFDKALLDELKRFREERKEAQQRLRELRRNLRQDKEHLGEVLFIVNTFLVPLLLVLGSIIIARVRAEKRAKSRRGEN